MLVKQNPSSTSEAPERTVMFGDANGKSEEVLAGRVERATKETRD